MRPMTMTQARHDIESWMLISGAGVCGMSDHRVPGGRAPLEDSNVRAARQGTVDARGVGPSGRYRLRCVVAPLWQPARVPAVLVGGPIARHSSPIAPELGDMGR